MGAGAEGRRPEQDRRLKEIPQWARRYAQNRTLPVLVNLAICAGGFLVLGGLSCLVAWAHVHGDRVVAGAAMLVLCGFAVWWLWFSLIGGARIMPRIAERLYQREGSVSLGVSEEHPSPKHLPLAGFLFMFCVAASVGLGVLGLLPQKHMQPISALYCVPFLVYLWAKQRPAGSPFMLLWPALYGLHAALLVAGAPIRFAGKFDVLNILLPAVGYGMVAALAAHIYSRVALRRLRTLMSSPEPPEQPEADAQ
jgi:hypothetical protein